MYDNILFPTNGGVASERAAESAVETAAAHGATLHVLYVVDEKVYGAYSGDEYVHEEEGLEAGLRQIGEETVEEVADEARSAGVEVVTEVCHGVPHEEILDYIDENGPDLVIMGTKERPGEYRQMLGSVTERVLRTTSAPVTVVKTPVSE
ncbi:MAG: universal stress protein [Halobacteriales archaeon]|nr:universal stress protein [Halobacteriales archaeon]